MTHKMKCIQILELSLEKEKISSIISYPNILRFHLFLTDFYLSVH